MIIRNMNGILCIPKLGKLRIYRFENILMDAKQHEFELGDRDRHRLGNKLSDHRNRIDGLSADHRLRVDASLATGDVVRQTPKLHSSNGRSAFTRLASA